MPAGLRRDLDGPLSTILARTHQLAPRVWRAPGLAEEERAVLLDGLFTIEAAARLIRHCLSETSEARPDAGTAVHAPASGEA